jgi:ribonuclease VapC
MFVDASALVAIITREPEADPLSDAIDAAMLAVTSPVAIFEAVLAVCRKRRASVAQGTADVHDLLAEARLAVVAIAAGDVDRALAAHALYGKGRGHPAQLNMGDCFAYALAKNHDLPLLYKGDDFSLTDIRAAWRR